MERDKESPGEVKPPKPDPPPDATVLDVVSHCEKPGDNNVVTIIEELRKKES